MAVIPLVLGDVVLLEPLVEGFGDVVVGGFDVDGDFFALLEMLFLVLVVGCQKGKVVQRGLLGEILLLHADVQVDKPVILEDALGDSVHPPFDHVLLNFNSTQLLLQ